MLDYPSVALDLRVGGLLLAALLTGSVAAADVGAPAAMDLNLAVPEGDRAPIAVIPGTGTPSIDLEEVRWSAPYEEPVDRLARRWGMQADELRALNNELVGREEVEPGERFVVYRYRPGEVSRSVGAPTRGRLVHGVPLPEGPHWRLRPHRPRTYGTQGAIEGLMRALAAWHRRDPEAAPLMIGELSKREGGRARPHSSHRSGRDVDIAYVIDPPPQSAMRWTEATAHNVELESTWMLIEALLKTGGVERIFVSPAMQAWLIAYTSGFLSQEEQRRLFQAANDTRRGRADAIIGAWAGHEDHMHIRFACTPADVRCHQPGPRAKKHRKRRRKRGRRRHRRRRR